MERGRNHMPIWARNIFSSHAPHGWKKGISTNTPKISEKTEEVGAGRESVPKRVSTRESKYG